MEIKYIKETLLQLNSLTDTHTQTGDVNSPLLPMDKSSKQKLIKINLKFNRKNCTKQHSFAAHFAAQTYSLWLSFSIQ